MRAFPQTLTLLAVAFALACGGGEERKIVAGEPSAEPLRDQRESLAALENQAARLAQTSSELQTVTAKINILAEQIDLLQATLTQHRQFLEEIEGVRRRGSGWLTDVWIFLLGIAFAMILYYGVRLFRGYDEGELPAEAHTPGMTTDAPLTDESP